MDHAGEVGEQPDVDAQCVLAIDVVADPGVSAACDAWPYLLGAHAVDLWHGTQESHVVVESGKQELLAQLLAVQHWPAVSVILLCKAADQAFQLLVQEFELTTVKPPPELHPHRAAAHASPIQHTGAELVLLVPPEPDVVDIEVCVTEGVVVRVAVHPPHDLAPVGVDLRQQVLVQADEFRCLALVSEQHLARLPNEVRGHADLDFELGLANARAGGAHTVALWNA
mmetsp:Transcript_29499/g.68577  ORF Transcript_29499/g.68577 Transcript_29499/m.68577 type:complete len:226 (-) Transcript_29499:1694-2371(-)